ncbi:hypothetical protein D3C86_1623080 [compost metagenome]
MVPGANGDDYAAGFEVPLELHKRDDNPEGGPCHGSPEEEAHALPVAFRGVEGGHRHPDDEEVGPGEDQPHPAFRLIDREECGEGDGPE